MNLGQLAELCEGKLIGSGESLIKSICSIESPVENSLTYVSSKNLGKKIIKNSGCAYIVSPEQERDIDLGIAHENPTKAFRLVLNALYPHNDNLEIAATVVFGDDVTLGKNITIGHNSVIGSGVSIADNCTIGANTIIDSLASVSEGTRIGNRVTVHNNCIIGSNCIISDGVVIGGQGFGFSFEGGRWEPIPQIGRVIIGDYVHVGSNSCIDRGAINDTVIGNNVIIDNLVHIAHNVDIGERTAMAACVGIAGSTKVGKNCLLAGQVGVAGHIEIADGVQINGGSRVLQSIKEPGVYAGSIQVMPVMRWNRMSIYLKKLETLFNKEKKQ